MNIPKNSRARFKKFFPEFLLFIALQILLNYNFPAFVRLGSPLNIVVEALVSVACVVVYAHLFLFPENYIRLINLEFFDDFQDPILFKSIFKGLMLMVCQVSWSYLWYIDYYNMSNEWYIILYSYYTFAFLIIRKVIKASRS